MEEKVIKNINKIYTIADKLGFKPNKPAVEIVTQNMYWIYFIYKHENVCMIHRNWTEKEMYTEFTNFIYEEGQNKIIDNFKKVFKID